MPRNCSLFFKIGFTKVKFCATMKVVYPFLREKGGKRLRREAFPPGMQERKEIMSSAVNLKSRLQAANNLLNFEVGEFPAVEAPQFPQYFVTKMIAIVR